MTGDKPPRLAPSPRSLQNSASIEVLRVLRVLLSPSPPVPLPLSVGTGHMLDKSRLAEKQPIAHREMNKQTNKK